MNCTGGQCCSYVLVANNSVILATEVYQKGNHSEAMPWIMGKVSAREAKTGCKFTIQGHSEIHLLSELSKN